MGNGKLTVGEPQELSICAYSHADFEDVTTLWLASARSTGVSTPVTLDDLRERWPKELAGGWTVYVARLRSSVVGFIAFKGEKLEQLFVAPADQGRGIGKTLLDFAKSQMPTGFHLTTAVFGGASRFYEREGLERGETSLHRFGFEIVRYDWRPPQA